MVRVPDNPFPSLGIGFATGRGIVADGGVKHLKENWFWPTDYPTEEIMNSLRLSRLSQSLALAALLCAGAGVLASKAHAGNATANLAVSAQVNANCTISTGALAFGAYDPVVANAATALNGTGSVTIACTKGSAPNITLDNGLNFGGATRNMKNTANADVLAYAVYQPPNTTPGTACTFPGSQAWATTGAAIFTPTSPASKAARTYNVCGTVSAGQDVSAGTYQDTVVASVNF